MIEVEKLFKEKDFPKWFKNHPIFKQVKTIKKVFPNIGIPNCEQEMEIDNAEPAKEAAKALKNTIRHKLNDRIKSLKKFIETHSKMNDARRAHGDMCLKLMECVVKQLDNKDVIRRGNGRLSLKLVEDVMLDGQERPTYRRDESIFRVYNKLTELLREQKFAAPSRLEDTEQFKIFSSENVPNNKYKIVFSSDGSEGAWDIGTMSARGVKSCQSWEGGDYKHCTIGSVIDPFVGIIYMTSGAKFNKYGSKMMRRSIVRFVINGKTGKPYLFLDNMYPSFDSKAFTQFKKLLNSKNSDLEVVYGGNIDHELLRDTYLPLNGVRKILQDTDREGGSNPNGDLESIQSYQDFRVNSKLSNKHDEATTTYTKNSKKKANKFIKTFQTAFSDAIKNTDIAEFPENLKPIISKLKGIDGKRHQFNYSYMMPELARIMANEFVKSVDRTAFLNSDTYLRRLYYNYFNNKKTAIDSVKGKICKQINGIMGLKANNKIKAESIAGVMNILIPTIDLSIKSNLKELIEKRKISEPLPLP